MLTIRAAQRTALARAADDDFVEAMIRRIASELPRQYESMGETGTREFVERSIAAALRTNVKVDGAVRRLVMLYCEFGERFELAPARAWALELLAQTQVPDVVRVSLIAERFEAQTLGRPIVRVKAVAVS